MPGPECAAYAEAPARAVGVQCWISSMGEIYEMEQKAPRPLEEHAPSRDNRLISEREGELLRNFHGRSFSFREACEGLRLGTRIQDIVIQ